MAELQTLKAMGVAIVMDDFGTGYSSLSYLWRFPFDKIKIDRSFMQGFDSCGRDARTVVKTIIALGRELNMRVTVEGVETAAQAAFLDTCRRRSGPGVLLRPASSRLRGQRQYSRGFSEDASSIIVHKEQTAPGQVSGQTIAQPSCGPIIRQSKLKGLVPCWVIFDRSTVSALGPFVPQAQT